MKTSHETDLEIVQRIVSNGEQQAYAVLVDRYKRQLFAFVGTMVTERETTEELAQDCFVKAYQRLAHYDSSKGTFYIWLRTIAYRLCLDYIRRRREQWLEIDERTLLNITDEEADSVMDTDDDERITLLMDAIRHLPPTERMLIQQYYFEEQPLSDIAVVTGTDRGTLTTRLHRIRRKLYHYMKAKEYLRQGYRFPH